MLTIVAETVELAGVGVKMVVCNVSIVVDDCWPFVEDEGEDELGDTDENTVSVDVEDCAIVEVDCLVVTG